MIRFACPKCQNPLKSPTKRGGATFPCPVCGTQVAVPIPHEDTDIIDGMGPCAPSPSDAAPRPEPPISFSCPRCLIVLEVPASNSGSKVACARCGQRLQVPQARPPLNKTMLGKLADPASGPTEAVDAAPADDERVAPRGLKFCHECGAQIRRKAVVCPKCGTEQPDLRVGRDSDDDEECPETPPPAPSNIAGVFGWLSLLLFVCYLFCIVISLKQRAALEPWEREAIRGGNLPAHLVALIVFGLASMVTSFGFSTAGLVVGIVKKHVLGIVVSSITLGFLSLTCLVQLVVSH